MAILNDLAINTVVNGQQLEYADVVLYANGIPITKGGIQSISYDWSLEPGVVNTNQIGATGVTRGSLTSLPTGNMQMLPYVYDQFLDQAVLNTGDGTITGAFFQIEVSMAIENIDGAPQSRVDTLLRCRISGSPMAMNKGNDNLFYDVKFTYQNILTNGVFAFPEPV